MKWQISNIFKFSLGLYARGIFVFAQFYTLWTYSNSFSVEELSIYNIAITFALLSTTLIFHPFDIELQKRFTRRVRIKSDISVVQTWYSLLTLGLSIIFILIICYLKIINQYLNMMILGILLSLSSYLSHSIRTLYLNAGSTNTYNLLILTESLVKMGLLLIFTYLENLSLFYFTNILIFSQALTLVYFYLNERRKLNLRRSVILIFMFDARYIYRMTSNSFHWVITNFFRFSLIISDRTGLLGMGLTFYSIGSAASQSVNMIVNQFLYPNFYHTKGKGLYKFCTIIAVCNLLLLILTYLLLDYFIAFLPPHFAGYESYVYAGILTETFNGILGPIGILDNFNKQDKRIRSIYIIGAIVALVMCFGIVQLGSWQLLFYVPAISLATIILFYIKVSKNER